MRQSDESSVLPVRPRDGSPTPPPDANDLDEKDREIETLKEQVESLDAQLHQQQMAMANMRAFYDKNSDLDLSQEN